MAKQPLLIRQTDKMEKKKHLGIWMDHSTANLIEYDELLNIFFFRLGCIRTGIKKPVFFNTPDGDAMKKNQDV